MTKIQWTDQTWNPITGCTPIAAGCKNCYAKEMHRRLRAMGQAKYSEPFDEVRCHLGELEKPLHWRKPRRVFVCSMSDLFHEDVPDAFIAAVFGVMGVCPQHTFQVLTKRPARMRTWFEWLSEFGAGNEMARCWAYSIYIGGLDDNSWKFGRRHFPLGNVWLGASASTQGDLDRMVPPLLKIPAAVRFLSLEPLLGPIDLDYCPGCNSFPGGRHGSGQPDTDGSEIECGPMIGPPVEQVIVGAESGPNRRPCKLDWIRRIRDDCQEAGVPLFVKQAEIDGRLVKMPEIDGVVWDQMPKTSDG